MLWRGPYIDGITYSMLCKFLVCRHRFWLMCSGLREQPEYDFKIHYGSMFHALLETSPETDPRVFLHKLMAEFPTAHPAISKWWQICKLQYNLYQEYWYPWERENHYTVTARESVFSIQYVIQNGPRIILRGKRDQDITLGPPSSPSTYLKETKTKGVIDEKGLSETVESNLQTMFYVISRIASGYKPKGVLYDVVRRPLADKWSPRMKKGESEKEFLDRIFHKYETRSTDSIYPIASHLNDWFFRWRITLRKPQIQSFQRRIFDPLLRQLCDWWESVSHLSDPFDSSLHYQTPYGVYNPLGTGMKGDFYDLLTSGRRTLLTKVDTMFPELE